LLAEAIAMFGAVDAVVETAASEITARCATAAARSSRHVT
jgi:hypothetical protein